jgi:V/A-type H+-transporting ATPase subunit C
MTFLHKHITSLIDIVNIKTYIRIIKYGFRGGHLSGAFIGGGAIEPAEYYGNLQNKPEQFLAARGLKPYEKITVAGLEYMRSDENAPYFEKEADEYTISYIRPFKYIAFGIEPVLAHILAKEYEALNVRTALTGIMNGFEPEIIRGRLRTTYV